MLVTSGEVHELNEDMMKDLDMVICGNDCIPLHYKTDISIE